MIAAHVHDALAQVRALQEFIIERNLFKGYSGTARIVSGVAALAGAAVLALGPVPAAPHAHLWGWMAVLTVGILVNYSALIYWFLFGREAGRNPLMLKPALDALPALGLGAALSLALVLHAQWDSLFGVWMGVYGLAQLAYKDSLPRGIYGTGLFYVGCGAWCLLAPGIHFLNPWPMGLVFFGGEMVGGTILIQDHRRSRLQKGDHA